MGLSASEDDKPAFDGAMLPNSTTIPHKFRSRSAGNPASYSPVTAFHWEGRESASRVTPAIPQPLDDYSCQEEIFPALAEAPSSNFGARLSSRADTPLQSSREAISMRTQSSSTTTYFNPSNHSWTQPYARQSGFTAPVPEAPAIVINHPNTRQVRQNWVSYFLGHLSIISRTSKLVLFFRVAFIILPVICSIFVLFLTWNEYCDYPLRTYLLIDVLRALVILPTVVYLHLMPEARRRRTSNEISHRWVERIKQYTDIFACCWFIIGNWWTFSSKSCSVPLHSMSLALIVLGYLHLFIPLIVCGAIIFCLPCVLIATRFLHMGDRTNGTSIGLGAPEELIRRIPIVSYSHKAEQANLADAVLYSGSAISSSDDIETGDGSRPIWGRDNEQTSFSDADPKRTRVDTPPPVGPQSPAALAITETVSGATLTSNRAGGADPKQARRIPPPRPPKPSPLSASVMRFDSDSFLETSKKYGSPRGSLNNDTLQHDTSAPLITSQTMVQSLNSGRTSTSILDQSNARQHPISPPISRIKQQPPPRPANSSQLFLEDEDAVCVICLNQYTEGERLRLFPCRHHFHVPCADAWLRVNKTCPLCVRDVAQSLSHTMMSPEAPETMPELLSVASPLFPPRRSFSGPSSSTDATDLESGRIEESEAGQRVRVRSRGPVQLALPTGLSPVDIEGREVSEAGSRMRVRSRGGSGF